MEFLGNWKFWLAVVVVTFVAHWAMMTLMPKLSGGSKG
jgi:hypothetical protein